MAWTLPTQHKERSGWEGSLGSSCRVRVVEGPGVVAEVAAGLARGGLQNGLQVQSSQQLANPRTCSAPWHCGLRQVWGWQGTGRWELFPPDICAVLCCRGRWLWSWASLGWCCLKWKKGVDVGAAVLFWEDLGIPSGKEESGRRHTVALDKHCMAQLLA